MSWLFYSLLAPLFWAIGNVGDKYVLSKWLKHAMGALMAFGIFGIIAAAIIFGVRGFGNVPLGLVFGCLLSGVLYMFANVYYFRAVQSGEVSRIIPIIYTEPLFTAAISAVILGEIFTPLKYLGVVLMVAGAIAISYHKTTGFKFSKGVWFALIASILFALNTVATKYLVDNMDFWMVFAYVRVGTFISLIPAAFIYKSAFKELISLKPKGMALLALTNTLGFSGILSFTYAATLGFITLTTSLSVAQPFFVLLFTLALSIFYPNFIKEETGKKIFFQKLFAIVLMFVGVLLIT